MIAGAAGDQQASLVGQGCLLLGRPRPPSNRGMSDCVTARRPAYEQRGPQGPFPSSSAVPVGSLWGAEAAMLGRNGGRLVGQLGLLVSPEQSDARSSVQDAGGVVFVPALRGLGTPLRDFGARRAERRAPRHRKGRGCARRTRGRCAQRCRPTGGGRVRYRELGAVVARGWRDERQRHFPPGPRRCHRQARGARGSARGDHPSGQRSSPAALSGSGPTSPRRPSSLTSATWSSRALVSTGNVGSRPASVPAATSLRSQTLTF